MPRPFGNSNRSQASLDQTINDPSHSVDPRVSQRGQHPTAETAYDQARDSGEQIYHPYASASQHQYYNQEAQTQNQYLNQAQYQHNSTPHSQVLGRSNSHRAVPQPQQTVSAYQEQQQIHQERSQAQADVLHPSLGTNQRQAYPVDENQPLQQPPYRQHSGFSNPARASAAREEKKKSSPFSGFFARRDKKETREGAGEPNRLNRNSSILQRTQGQAASTRHNQSSQRIAQPGNTRSESISAYLESNAEDTGSQQQYNQERPPAESTDRAQHSARQSSESAGQLYSLNTRDRRHEAEYGQVLQGPSSPQTQTDQAHTNQQFISYTGQVTQERSFAPSETHSLRPPSQGSVGPPSPLYQQAQPAPRAGTTRYSITSSAVHQSAAQEALQNLQEQEREQIHTSPPVIQVQDQDHSERVDMPSQRDTQRNSRLQPEDNSQYAAQQDPRIRMSTQEQGRSTPPPRTKEDISQLDHNQLIQRYEELQAKYSKVKRYYFDRENTITQLQNTVATQRLSMSKTSLDDAQYAARFERLNGAIQNIAFNIRRDWRRVPNWLAPACNRDACQTGTRECTAIGRATISRWLYDHVFQSIFHPGINPQLSSQLKQIERSLRRAPGPLMTEDQIEDQRTKVTTWRLTTCEGLFDDLKSRQTELLMDQTNRYLTDQICDHLRTFLDPAADNLEGMLAPIVGQALSIAANIPLESRDICIEYFLPGRPFHETYMRLESGLTPLVDPGSAPNADSSDPDPIQEREDSLSSASDGADANDVEAQIREAAKQASSSSKSERERPKKQSLFGGGFGGGLVNKKPPGQSQSNNQRAPSSHDLTTTQPGQSQSEEDHLWTFDAMTQGGKTEGKIRLAMFLAVEVRGKRDVQSTGSGGNSGNGNGNGANTGTGELNNGSGNVVGTESAGPGVGGQENAQNVQVMQGGGPNVLAKAPVFGF